MSVRAKPRSSRQLRESLNLRWQKRSSRDVRGAPACLAKRGNEAAALAFCEDLSRTFPANWGRAVVRNQTSGQLQMYAIKPQASCQIAAAMVQPGKKNVSVRRSRASNKV